MRKTFGAVIVCILTLAGAAQAGKITGDQVVASVKKTYAAINDYRVDASLSITGPNIKISKMAMTIYYKKPNRVHVEAKDGVALVPQGSFVGNPIEELSHGSKATYLRSENKAGCYCHVVGLTSPNGPETTLWVDGKRGVIVASESSGQYKAGSIWRYKLVDGKYYLPVEISAVMSVPGGGGFGRGSRHRYEASGPQQANMVVSFSNYVVNKGISDKIFERKSRD